MITVYTTWKFVDILLKNSSPSWFLCLASSIILSTPLEIWRLLSMKVGFSSPAKREVGLCAYLMDIPCVSRWLGKSNEVGEQCLDVGQRGLQDTDDCILWAVWPDRAEWMTLQFDKTSLQPHKDLTMGKPCLLQACQQALLNSCSALTWCWAGGNPTLLHACCNGQRRVICPREFCIHPDAPELLLLLREKRQMLWKCPRQKLSSEALTGRIGWLGRKLF